MSGHVQSRGDGTWRIFIDNGRAPLTGRRRRITRTFMGTKRQAEREAEPFVVSVRDGHGGAVSTVGALLDPIIHRACEQARRWGWLDRNPAELAEPPTTEPRSTALPPIAEIVTVFERLTVDMRDLVWVAIITGRAAGNSAGSAGMTSTSTTGNSRSRDRLPIPQKA